MTSEVFNEDCMAVMARYPDKYFDLAVVDPPYGIDIGNRSATNFSLKSKKNGRQALKYYPQKDWDKAKPSSEYWNELFRVSKNQIVWGGNYFIEHLSVKKCWIVWNKQTRDLTFSDGELAWTSFDIQLKIIDAHRIKLWQENPIHPTQKPVYLYDWIFNKFANKLEKVIDTHLGSGSSRIAAYKAGLSFVGCELDKEYFEAQEKRYKEFISQLTLF